MFIPIGDSPNSPATPWVTRALVAANVLVYLLVTLPLSRPLDVRDRDDPAVLETLEQMWELQGPQYSAAGVGVEAWLAGLTRYDLLVFEYGYTPVDSSWLDLLTCMFLHGGFLHLAGNMLYLWIFGDNVEARLGGVRYLVAYLATGIAGTAAFAALNPGGVAPLVGASGAISGMLGFYFVWFPRNRVKVFLALWPFFLNVIQVRAYWALLFYFVIQNVVPALSGNQGSVAYTAHIGGFLGGALLAFGIGRWLPSLDAPSPGRSFAGRGPPPRVEVVDAPAAYFAQLVRQGRMKEAAQTLPQALHRGDPIRLADALALGQWLMERGEFVRAEAVYRYTLRGRHSGEPAALAHLRLGEILLQQGRHQPARSHLFDCIDIAPEGSDLGERARALLSRLDGS